MTAKTTSLKDRIKAAGAKAGRHEHTVEEWGGETIYLHEMSVADAEEFIGVAKEIEDGGDEAVAANLGRTVDMLMRAVRDADGGRLFEGEDDREWLTKQPIRVVNALASALMEHSGMKQDATDDAKNA